MRKRRNKADDGAWNPDRDGTISGLESGGAVESL